MTFLYEMFGSIDTWWWIAYVVVLLTWLVRSNFARKTTAGWDPRARKMDQVLDQNPGDKSTIEALRGLGVEVLRERGGTSARDPASRRIVVASIPAWMEEGIPRNPVLVYASALTSLGLIGTFVGLGLAAHAFESALAVEAFDVRAIQDMQNAAVTEFVHSMSTAFGTSILGLGAAMVIVFVDTWSDRATRYPHAGIRERFLKQFTVAVPEQLLYSAQEADLDTAAARLADGAAAISVAATKFDADAMSRAIAELLDQNLRPVLGEIRDALNGLREQNESNVGDVITRALDQLREQVLIPMSTAVTGNTQANHALVKTVSALTGELPSVTRAVEANSHAMKIFADSTSIRLSSFTDDLASVLNRFTDDSRAVFATVPPSIEAALGRVRDDVERMLASTESSFRAQESAFRQYTEQTRAEFVLIRDTSVQLMREQHAQLDDVARRSAELLTHAREELVAGIHSIPKMLESVRTETQRQLAEFQRASLDEMSAFRVNYEAQLQSFFEQQSIHLEATLGRQREGLARVVADLTTAYANEAVARAALGQRVDDQLAAIADHTSDIDRLQARMATWLPKVAADLTLTHSASVEHVSALSTMLRSIVEVQEDQVALITQHQRQALENLAGTTSKMHADLDAAVLDICRHLAGVAGILVGVGTRTELPGASL